MRCRPDGVRGVMEALIARSIEEACRLELAEVSLGLAPLAITPGHADDLFNRALTDIYGRLDRFRKSRSLRHLKSKFAPAWEERYLAVPSTASQSPMWEPIWSASTGGCDRVPAARTSASQPDDSSRWPTLSVANSGASLGRVSVSPPAEADRQGCGGHLFVRRLATQSWLD
jgi:hypothetical protein